MAESNSFTGVVSSTRDTFQKLTSKDKFSTDVQWACFNKNAAMKAMGVEGFGVDAMKNLQAFGAAKPTGRIIRVDQGGYAFSGALFAETGTSYHTGRMGTFTPQLVEGGDEYVYSWHELDASRYIPVNDVDDNSGGNIKLQVLREQEMKQTYVRDFNYCVLGNSSAPDASVMGPSTVYADLPNLISVTQTRTVGGIATTASKWQNGYKAVTSIGGGGEMDRPLTLRRAWLDQHNDQMIFAEATDDYLFICTQGAWQYYDRLMYADAIEGGQGGAVATSQKYDAVGIQHKMFNGHPLVWDPAVTVPYGATASTEAIYGIHVPSFVLAIRKEKNFKFSGWEAPRNHDDHETLVAKLQTRYTPAVVARRPHYVVYNIPACTD